MPTQALQLHPMRDSGNSSMPETLTKAAELLLLFSAPMVQAWQAGRKTQTRRVLKLPKWATGWEDFETDGEVAEVICAHTGCMATIHCGKAGDTLVGRETYWAWGYWEKVVHLTADRPAEKHFIWDQEIESVRYCADDRLVPARIDDSQCAWHKRPAIFLPRFASRLVAPVKSVRIQRVQDISEEDAIAEGIEVFEDGTFKLYGAVTDDLGTGTRCPLKSFRSLWISINGKASWDSNPWVRAIEFTNPNLGGTNA